MKTYQVIATREGDWWVLRVPSLDMVTQSRRLDQAEAMARDLIALWLDVGHASFAINVSPQLDETLVGRIAETREAQKTAADAAALASGLMRQLVFSLIARRYTVRDIGAILGISPQRVSQLAVATDGKPHGVRRVPRGRPAGSAKSVAASTTPAKAAVASKGAARTVAAEMTPQTTSKTTVTRSRRAGK